MSIQQITDWIHHSIGVYSSSTLKVFYVAFQKRRNEILQDNPAKVRRYSYSI